MTTSASRLEGLKSTDWYRVRYENINGWDFGVANMYATGDERETVEELSRRGEVYCDHPVYPTSFKVEESSLVSCDFVHIPPVDLTLEAKAAEFYRWGEDCFDDYMSLEGLAHQIRSVGNTGDKPRVNDLFSIGVADGAATYVVVKANDTSCVVEWRGMWNQDRYIDHYFGWGRVTRTSDVARYVTRERGISRIAASNDKNMTWELFSALMQQYRHNHGFEPYIPI